MGLGYGLGVSFLVLGGVFYPRLEYKTVPILFLVTGGLEMLLGIVATVMYVHYDKRVREVEQRLDLTFSPCVPAVIRVAHGDMQSHPPWATSYPSGWRLSWHTRF